MKTNFIRDNEKAFAPIEQAIKMTGGLTLSQLAEIAGLEPSTIQNWVKRGWVEPPVMRRYGVQTAARALIIGMLRGAMQISDIVALMTYVNGRVDDRSDDLIPDYELYNILISMQHKLQNRDYISADLIRQVIDVELVGYKEPYRGGETKLRNALEVMVLAYLSSDLKKRAARLFRAFI